jgi:uncharacterized protein (TIGR03067 family)
MTRWPVVLTAGVVLAAAGAGAANAQNGLDKLEGAWVAVSWKRGDTEIGKDQVATELVLAKTTYEFPQGINRISRKGAFKIDAAKGTIDFTPEDGPAAGRTLLGLYKVEGDTLTLCFTSAGRERPKELKTDDRNTVLAKYERKKK